MGTYVHKNFPDIIRSHIGFIPEIGAGLRHSGKSQSPSGTYSQFDHRVCSGSLDQSAYIMIDPVVDKDPPDFFLHLDQLSGVCGRRYLFNSILGNTAFQNRNFLADIRIAHSETNCKTIQLGLGKKLCPLRIRQDSEWR